MGHRLAGGISVLKEALERILEITKEWMGIGAISLASRPDQAYSLARTTRTNEAIDSHRARAESCLAYGVDGRGAGKLDT